MVFHTKLRLQVWFQTIKHTFSNGLHRNDNDLLNVFASFPRLDSPQREIQSFDRMDKLQAFALHNHGFPIRVPMCFHKAFLCLTQCIDDPTVFFLLTEAMILLMCSWVVHRTSRCLANVLGAPHPCAKASFHFEYVYKYIYRVEVSLCMYKPQRY